MQEFLNMGGYGGYVWPSYLISAAVLIALAVSIWRRGGALARQLKDSEKKSAAGPSQ